MTDWIDKFAASLGEGERRKHIEYQHNLLRDRLITERAPEFFNSVASEVQTQVAELNQKVGGTFGGVIYSPSSASEATTSFTVLGGQFKTDNFWTGKTDIFRRPRLVSSTSRCPPSASRVGLWCASFWGRT